MKISDIRIRLLTKSDDNKRKANASFTIDNCFVIHEVGVIEGSKGLFMSMPRRKIANGEFKDICHPIDTATRNSIEAQILEAYDKAVANAETGEK